MPSRSVARRAPPGRARRGRARAALRRDERGLSTAEYLIALFLIAVIGTIAWKSFGAATEESASGAATSVQSLRGEGGGEGLAETGSGRASPGEAAPGHASEAQAARGRRDAVVPGGVREESETGDGGHGWLRALVVLFAFFALLPILARLRQG